MPPGGQIEVMLRADRRRRPALESLGASQIGRQTVAGPLRLRSSSPGGILAALSAPEAIGQPVACTP